MANCLATKSYCCTLVEAKRRSVALATPHSMADHRSGRCGRQLGEAVLRSHRPLGHSSGESVSAMEILQQLWAGTLLRVPIAAGSTVSCPQFCRPDLQDQLY